MTDINTVSLVSQMRALATQAQGGSVEGVANEGASKTSFDALLKQAFHQVSSMTNEADDLKVRFEKGDADVSLVDTMVSYQKAKLGEQAFVTVRNKMVQAYQDIMGMSI